MTGCHALIKAIAADDKPDLQNALGLMGDYLDQCACDLSELHRRSEVQP